jgi:hypothetical protein
MKKTLLTLFLICFLGSYSFAQVTAGQVDTFESGTTLSWHEGGGSPNPPTNIATDGPAGAGDHYLQNVASGNTGPGGRLSMFNDSQWLGDYTAQSIISIKFDARALTNDVDLRISMTGDGGKFSSKTFVTVAAGTGWTSVTIPIRPEDLQSVSDGNDSGPTGFDVDATLAEVSQLRIISNPSPAWRGEFVNATLEVDNIEASTTLSVNDFKKVDFSIYPNPSKSKLNISLNTNDNSTKVEVFDVLGKRIHMQTLTNLHTSINASNWNAGVYLVKITNSTGTQTKRFVKE